MNMKNNILFLTMLVFLLTGLAFFSSNIYKRVVNQAKLDEYYLNSLKSVKSRLLYGSSVDTKKDLEDYQDRIELYMYLEGYNGIEIMDIRCKALVEATRERRYNSNDK